MMPIDIYIRVCPYISMPKGYSTSKTSVHFIGYHFVWCPKFRRKVLISKVEQRLNELIKEKAEQLECRALALEVMPDHVHPFIEGKPLQTPNYIIGQIKGYTSHQLREEFADLRLKLLTLWTKSYFVSIHEHISDKLIERYIAEQKGM
jgi:putative transposase